MEANDTLSAEQWSSLQALFDQALSANSTERRRLVNATLASDLALGRTLAALLASHEQWRDHTGDACDELHRQAHASALLANGESIGPYRILGVLGEGGMGVVYRAERADGEVALTVAIKVLRPRTLDVIARERFQRERDLLASLNHRHIARLFDAGVGANGQPYFVMEYVRGANIVNWCDERRLDIRARLRLFIDVCGAVRYAHNQLVLHRDIKPSNVLVDDSGVAKLIDFGVAKSIALDAAVPPETATAHRFFSPLNVAPEQLRGERMGVACDVYQLGTLLYELLCGQPIFDLEGKTLRSIGDAIDRQIPEAPSVRASSEGTALAVAHGCADGPALARQLQGDLDEITLMALRKEPARRYASVEQLIEDIERHLELRPVRARGSHRTYRVSRFIRRHWRSLGMATAVTLAGIAFVTAIASQSRQLQIERDRAVAEQHRAEEATKFLIGVFKAADPTVSLSRDTPIGDVLENGRRALDAELSGQPLLMGDLSFALGSIYSDLEDPVDAQKYAKRSVQLRQALDPGSIAVAESLGELAISEAQARNCKDAVADGTRAVDLFHKLGVSVSKSVDVQTQIIRCRAQREGAASALASTHSLLEALERDPSSTVPQVAALEVVAAEYQEGLGDWKVAESLQRSAIDRLQHSPWKDSAQSLRAQEGLAGLLSKDGRHDQARAIYDTLLPAYATIYGRKSLNYAELQTERSFDYQKSGRFEGEGEVAQRDAREVLREHEVRATSLLMDKKFDDAQALLDRLAHDYEQIYGHDSLDYADLLAERGTCLFDSGRFRDAEADMLEVRRIRTAVHAEPRTEQAIAARNLAVLYEYGIHDKARAAAFNDEAVRLASASIGSDDLDTIKLKTARAIWLARLGRDQEAAEGLRILQAQLAARDRAGTDVRLALAAIQAHFSEPAKADQQLALVQAAIATHPAFARYAESFSSGAQAAAPASYTNDSFNLPTTHTMDAQVDLIWKAWLEEWHRPTCRYRLDYAKEGGSKIAQMVFGPSSVCAGYVNIILVGVPPGHYLGPDRLQPYQAIVATVPPDIAAQAAKSK